MHFSHWSLTSFYMETRLMGWIFVDFGIVPIWDLIEAVGLISSESFRKLIVLWSSSLPSNDNGNFCLDWFFKVLIIHCISA